MALKNIIEILYPKNFLSPCFKTIRVSFNYLVIITKTTNAPINANHVQINKGGHERYYGFHLS